MHYRQHAKTLMASALSFSIAFSPLALGLAQAQSSNDAKPAQQADGDWEKEFTLWRNATKSGLQADYEAYLKAYPKGKFAKVAKARIESLVAKTTSGAPAEDTADAAKTDDSGQVDGADAADTSQPAIIKQAPASSNIASQPAGDDQDAADQSADTGDDAQTAQATTSGDTGDQAPAGSEWEQEYALWKASAQGNTVIEYEAYLKAYPKGKFAAIAQSRIVSLAAAEQPVANVAEGDEDNDADANNAGTNDAGKVNGQRQNAQQQMDEGPAEDDQSAQNKQAAGQEQDEPLMEGTPDTEEQALDYEGRVEIQGRLSSIGYDLGAVDGAYGPRTRNAIAAWQEANAAPVSGYLSLDQVDLIREQSEKAYADWLEQNNEVSEPVIVPGQRVIVDRVVRPRVMVRPRVVVRPRFVVRHKLVIGKRCFINNRGRRVCRR